MFSFDNPDIPTYVLTLGRQSAVRAQNARQGPPIVKILCGGNRRGKCHTNLGGVWNTEHGNVLVVSARLDDIGLARAYKANARLGPDPDQFDHFPDSDVMTEEPILLNDVRVATVWCRRHGSWGLNLRDVRGQVEQWKWERRRLTYLSVPPSVSTVDERSARRL